MKLIDKVLKNPTLKNHLHSVCCVCACVQCKACERQVRSRASRAGAHRAGGSGETSGDEKETGRDGRGASPLTVPPYAKRTGDH